MVEKHTPGPWLYRSYSNGTHLKGPLLNGSNLPVSLKGITVLLSHPINDDQSAMGGHPELSADARLIAAAPELLAACKLAYSILPEGNCGREELGAAIAKSTPAQPEFTYRVPLPGYKVTTP